MKKVNKRYFDNPGKYIPGGIYCYDSNGICPFWDKDSNREFQSNGYCHYLGFGDWESDFLSLLWDQCKECSVNDIECL